MEPETHDTPLKSYLFTYFHRGDACELVIDAYSPGDAMVRVANMAHATLQGELVEEVIPVVPAGGSVTIMSTQN